ncbi:hypothetical protein ASPBRDRAFT_36819 [Aspergillus brasiliensis CBS 101740]|uniref:Uncharacterized protein n=1 Tax=Aspergillus brasiliensis (strain CBS 101740 / IMI 381727 / IBT 21946) TaxID=767769 RepID=A0A1L9V0X1_ASPBC|nr:hypothetical protein ASPBRDRAFT_36819 [Aspergillus brasiliensis CBS 101740]
MVDICTAGRTNCLEVEDGEKEEGLVRRGREREREEEEEEKRAKGRRRSKMSEQDSLQLDGLRSSSSVMVGRRAGQHLSKGGAESSGEATLPESITPVGGRVWYRDSYYY